jgi:hypothetical protein
VKVKGKGDLAVLRPPSPISRLPHLPRNQLPPKAKEGSWLSLDIIPEGEFVAGQPRNIMLIPPPFVVTVSASAIEKRRQNSLNLLALTYDQFTPPTTSCPW